MNTPKPPLMCRTFGHKYTVLSIGTIATDKTHDTITIYTCDRCMMLPSDEQRQDIERRRMRRGERIGA